MSNQNDEEFEFDSKDYLVLANTADRNKYFTKEEKVEIMAKEFLKSKSTREIRAEIIENRVQELLKGKQR